jgi:hypothetical protein
MGPSLSEQIPLFCLGESPKQQRNSLGADGGYTREKALNLHFRIRKSPRVAPHAAPTL